MRLFKSKKGNFPDIQDYLVNTLLIGFALVIGFTILVNFNSGITVAVNESTLPSIAETASDNYNSIFFKFDFITPIILLGFLGFSLVAARLIPSSSKFILIPVLSMLFFPVIAMVLENVWDSFRLGSSVQSAINNLFFTDFILSNLVVISLLYAFLIGVALYTKNEVSP